MIWFWYAFIGSLVLLVISLFIPMKDEYDLDSLPKLILIVSALLSTMMFLILGLCVSVGRHYDRINCHKFAETTNRPTKYVIYSILSDECLTPTTKNGKVVWIPTKNLREFGE